MTSTILDTVTRVAYHTIWVLSVFLLFSGHNQPGGGFVGGLVGGAGLVLQWAAHGTPGVERVMPVRPERLVGAGLGLAALTGVVAWALGGQFLDSDYVETTLPVLGPVKFVSTLVFDVGVYLVVIGLAAGLLANLGRPQLPGASTPRAGGDAE